MASREKANDESEIHLNKLGYDIRLGRGALAEPKSICGQRYY